MSEDEFSQYPPTVDEKDWNALVKHGLQKGCSYIAFKVGSNYKLCYGFGEDQAGKLIQAATDTNALTLLNWLKNNAAENCKTLFQHGDYTVSSKFSTTKKLRFEGEGSGTRIVPSGGFDALDPTNLSLFNIVWQDSAGTDHDYSLDPNVWEESLYEHKRGIKFWRVNAAVCNLWGCSDFIILATGGGSAYKCRCYKLTYGGQLTNITYNLQTIDGDGSEIVAACIDPKGIIYVSTHPENIYICKLDPGTTTWDVIFDSTDKALKSVYNIFCNYRGYIFFTGRHSTGPYRGIWRTGNMGSTWTEEWNEAVDWIFGMDDHIDVMCAAAQDAIIRSTDYGQNWSKITANVSGYTLRNVVWIEDKIWAASVSSYQWLFFSFDDGATWIKCINNTGIKCGGIPISMVRSSTGALAVATDLEPAVSISKTGAIWKVIRPPMPGSVVRGIYLTEETLWIGGYNKSPSGYGYTADACLVCAYPIDLTNLKGDHRPSFFWENASIAADDYSDACFIRGVSKIRVFFKASATGTLTLQIWNEQSGAFEDYDTKTISTANTLESFGWEIYGTAIRLQYSAASTVSSWIFMEE